jgi:hypothetical protein
MMLLWTVSGQGASGSFRPDGHRRERTLTQRDRIIEPWGAPTHVGLGRFDQAGHTVHAWRGELLAHSATRGV